MIQSLLTEKNPFNDTAELLEWIERRNREVQVEVCRVPLAELEGWRVDEEGSLRHRSGRFFSVKGIHIETDYGTVPVWDQPIIYQPEIGYLGILAKVFDGVLYFLMQALLFDTFTSSHNINLDLLPKTVFIESDNT